MWGLIKIHRVENHAGLTRWELGIKLDYSEGNLSHAQPSTCFALDDKKILIKIAVSSTKIFACCFPLFKLSFQSCYLSVLPGCWYFLSIK